MKVSVPKEIKMHEYRVGLTPGAAREYLSRGHSVLLEAGAADGIGASDEMYRKAGATIIDTAKDVFAAADLVIEVVPLASSQALNNATLPFGLALADEEPQEMATNLHLRAGLKVHNGRITNEAVANGLNSPFLPADQAIAG